MLALCSAQKERRQQSAEWDHRQEVKGNTKACANLTMVLDNWKFAITSQVKDLLLNDHRTDSAPVRAPGDLYQEFNSLKDRLAELTTRFDGVEVFVEDKRGFRGPKPSRAEHPAPPSQDPAEGATEQGRRKKVIRKRPKSPPA
ncbi:hypothetical protein COCON_G00020010 [Conger conger]|uniref:Uncharacterized protein n=1 Tax=Conger conger TaxID=82655 RepID=A0A9Q1DWN1_CONCO|nr:hypothetical protein COCON_G00020010 [Conger conger]